MAGWGVGAWGEGPWGVSQYFCDVAEGAAGVDAGVGNLIVPLAVMDAATGSDMVERGIIFPVGVIDSAVGTDTAALKPIWEPIPDTQSPGWTTIDTNAR